MPADRLLSTLLRSLQTYADQEDTPRILGTASALLTTLGNPHNLSLLTTHLLTAPAFWDRPDGVATPSRLLSVFHHALRIVVNHHNDVRHNKAPEPQTGQPPIGGGLSLDEWTRAVIAGADERSPRWKHPIVLGGLFIGFASLEAKDLDIYWASGTKGRVGDALIKALNLAVIEVRQRSETKALGGHTITMVLKHAFPHLSDMEYSLLNQDFLLPVLTGTAFFSIEGFQSAYFLGGLDLDIQNKAGKLMWNSRSPSFRRVEAMMARPLMNSMGPLSRIIANTIMNVQNPRLIRALLDELASFARALTTQWRQIRFSELDQGQEKTYLDEETLNRTLPQLRKLLNSALFATAIVLSGAMERILGDPLLTTDVTAPVLAAQTLQTLRHLYFITARLGTPPSQYTFVYLAAIDILASHPTSLPRFFASIAPEQLGHIPHHALDRTLDLFFLNTAEHFTLILPPNTNEDLLVASALPYLADATEPSALPIFEAAHSVMLAVLSAPRSASVTAKHLPFYVDALFGAFPRNLTPRQFRLAFKTLMGVTAPPSTLSATHPELPAILLELVFHRALTAPREPLPADETTTELPGSESQPTPLSEQAVLALSLIDALPVLPIILLEEWMPLCAELLNAIEDDAMRNVVKMRYWEILVNGEMDSEHSSTAAAWWGTCGGREMVLFRRETSSDGYAMMSGALPVPKPLRESRL